MGWQYIKFEQAIERVPKTSKVAKKKFLEVGTYPIISQESDFINGYWDIADDVFKVDEPVLIFGDHTRIVKYVDFNFVLGADGVKVLKPISQINPRYFYYYLNWVPLKSLGYARHYRLLKEKEVPVPPLAEQKQIVTILDEAFADVDRARELAERNLNNARELFDSTLNQIFSQRGESWESEKFGDVCEFVRGPFGGSLKKNIFKSDGYAVYEQQHAINDQFTSIRYFIDEEKFKGMKRFELLPGDLIMSCSGTMGKIAIVPEAIKPGIINQALLKLSPSDKINRKFLKLWMQSNDFQHKIEALAQGVAIRNMASVRVLKLIDVPIASPQQQAEIVEKLQYCGEETRKLEMIYQKKITALNELKQSLLRKAFQGELTGKDFQAA